MSFTSLLARQIAFSRATFGPNERTEGVLDHITKEQKEVRDSHDAFARALEWTDIHMLARDGHWRAVAHAFPDANTDQIAKIVEEQLTDKLDKNERRDWPYWKDADESKAIEHVKPVLDFEIIVLHNHRIPSSEEGMFLTVPGTEFMFSVTPSETAVFTRDGQGTMKFHTTKERAISLGLLVEDKLVNAN